MPPPITTALRTAAEAQLTHPHTVRSTRCIACSKFSTWARIVVGRTLAVAVVDRLEQRAMRLDRLLELVRAIERDRPDPEREHVVLLERRLEEVVVRRAVDGAVDPLVEAHQLAAAGVELGEQARASSSRSASVARSAASRAASGSSTAAHLGEARELAHVDAGHEHPAARVDLDEPLLGEPPERLAHRRPADLEPLDQLPLVDHARPARARVRRSARGSRDRPCPRGTATERYFSHILLRLSDDEET